MDQQDRNLFIDAQPQVSVFIAQNGKIQISVRQMDDAGERIEFNSIELPVNLVGQVAQAMLRLSV